MNNVHKHKCFYCQYIWEHNDDCAFIEEAHKCPSCGKLHPRNFNQLNKGISTIKQTCAHVGWNKFQPYFKTGTILNVVIPFYDIPVFTVDNLH